MSALVACGGTGAHVSLALLRLHTLGHALGFFRVGDEALEFPSIYLVDQDAGDGRDEKTAWQLVRQLVEEHPASHDWWPATGRSLKPECREVTPIPVGRDRNWYNAPYDRLDRKFADSAYLKVLTAEPQRKIAYSRGMMGSPAVGSLLLELKKLDRNDSGKNNEAAYERLLEERGSVVVAGSGVGGTGAAVGPSLALELERSGADVMAAMVLSWFRFETQGLEEATRDRAQLRNDAMKENANSALQFYGERLARKVVTVPIGSPERSLVQRAYTSDTQQPARESYLHAVAALCAWRHYTDVVRPGLYRMGAEHTGRLGGGTGVPGGTLQCLANRAATLADVVEALAHVLRKRSGKSPFRSRPAVLDHVPGAARVGKELALLAGQFRQHLDWLRDVLKVVPARGGTFTLEGRLRARLSQDPLGLGEGTRHPADAARVVFQWLGRWITEEAPSEDELTHRVGQVNGGYWPELRGEGLSLPARAPGRLEAVRDQDIGATLQAFVDPESVTANGWPSPTAGADYFEYAIKQRRTDAVRRLEMLLVGLMREDLELRELPPIDSRGTPDSGLTLERLVAEQRARGMDGLATHAVVYRRGAREVELGFNSPVSLLAPVPCLSADRENLEAWSELWAKLTGDVVSDDWASYTGPVEWRNAQAEVNQLRLWLDRLNRDVAQRHGQPPAWVGALFQDQRGTPKDQAFGMGARLVVRWGPEPLEIDLPARRTGVSRVGGGTTIPVTLDDLRAKIPSLDRLEDDTFWKVEFEMPGLAEPISAYWKEHLEALQRRGLIADYLAEAESRRLRIYISSSDNGLEECQLEDTVVLDRDQLIVRSCTPMRQDPIPGSAFRQGEVLFPTLPIRSDYLSLVRTADGHRLLDQLKAGEAVDLAAFKPRERESMGKRVAEWGLLFEGRKEAQAYVVPVPSEPHRSHWMVWPNFRAADSESPWRAYYVYDHCTDRRIRTDTLWLDPETRRIRLRRADTERDYGSAPLRFETGSNRRHTGGPPLALVARNTASGNERGIYVVQLRRIGVVGGNFSLGVDFGTSHTVAAVRAGGDPEGQPVGLFPEFVDRPKRRLSLHVSENRKHCTDDLLPRSTWFPTYVEELPAEAESLLPSELLTLRPLADYDAVRVADWKPGQDCFIPPMNLAGYRNELARHIVSDFKWDASHRSFRGAEDALREIYLGMVLEQVLADVVEGAGGVPTGRVDVTFTYPLRSSRDEVRQYELIVRRVLESCSEGSGVRLDLKGGVGLYDESRAARGGTKQVGDISVVADLGGGTLDLCVSAERAPDARFREVADSVRLGANRLLRKLAEAPERFLPGNGGWQFGDVDECEKQLRAWMRAKGSNALFGVGQAQSGAEPLKLRGFEHAADAEAARNLIGRYFHMLVDYVARYVVAYLGTHWQDRAGQHRERLKIWLQLRGNGWRLWQGSASYVATQGWVGSQLEARVADLWEELDGTRFRAPAASRWQKASGEVKNPKLVPICRAAGKARSDAEARRHQNRHVLLDLDLVGGSAPVERVRWFTAQPFDVGSKTTRVELGRIEPPIRLSGRGDERIELDDLSNEGKRRINVLLGERGERGDKRESDYQADVAAWVWEEAFGSHKLLTEE